MSTCFMDGPYVYYIFSTYTLPYIYFLDGVETWSVWKYFQSTLIQFEKGNVDWNASNEAAYKLKNILKLTYCKIQQW